MSKDVFIFLLVKVWKISYQTCWVVSSQFFSWCRVSACWNKIWVELSILNRSEAKFELVMIPTLLLFKCNLLCYHVRNKWGKTPVTKSVNHNRIYLLKKPSQVDKVQLYSTRGYKLSCIWTMPYTRINKESFNTLCARWNLLISK